MSALRWPTRAANVAVTGYICNLYTHTDGTDGGFQSTIELELELE